MAHLFRIEGIMVKNRKLRRKVRGLLAGIPAAQRRKEVSRTPCVVCAESVVRELTLERKRKKSQYTDFEAAP